MTCTPHLEKLSRGYGYGYACDYCDCENVLWNRERMIAEREKTLSRAQCENVKATKPEMQRIQKQKRQTQTKMTTLNVISKLLILNLS